MTDLPAALTALKRSGRRVLEVVDGSPRSAAVFLQARARLAGRCECRPHVRGPLFHTTTVAAGRSIMDGGFRIPKSGARGTAFGRGVNMTRELRDSLHFCRDETCATLVCEAVIGRIHENETLEVPGSEHTVAERQRPRPGFDAMQGFGGQMVVVPCAARVRAVHLIVHCAVPSPRH